MSDARIQELEAKLGDLENERGYLFSDKEEAEDTIRTCNNRIAEIDGELEELTEKINHEPFDEEV